MIDLSSLPVKFQFAIFALMFTAVFLQFFLIVYKFYLTGRITNIAFDTVLFLTLAFQLCAVTGSRSKTVAFYEMKIPYYMFVFPAVLVILYTVSAIYYMYKTSKKSLTPNSVKQALDNLNSAICFIDDTGKIVLINHTMLSLMYSLSGRYPQIESEFSEYVKSEQVTAPDGKIWQFSSADLTVQGFEGFCRITASDITEIYSANIQLEDENAALAETNEEIGVMLERLSQRIREQETLNLKTQIHNDIGTSLISLSKIMKEDEKKDMQGELLTLENAVSYFSQNRIVSKPVSCEASAEKAKKMGVNLVFVNVGILNESQKNLILSAADESVTNCINHANGDKVTVSADETEDAVTIRITNNGTPPVGEIIPGGGLNSLRSKIENGGGKMYFTYSPEFALIISFEKGSDSIV